MFRLHRRTAAIIAYTGLYVVVSACAPQRSSVVSANAPEPRRITPSGPDGGSYDTMRRANPWFLRDTANSQAGDSPSTTDTRGTFRREHNDPLNVALLVPLSGKFASIGQQMLQAAQLAIFTSNQTRVNILPYDTQGDAYQAVRAYREAEQKGTHVILGPLFSGAAKAIAGPARAAGIPVVSFSNNSTLAADGVFVFGKIPETQYKTLTDYALSQGIETFSLLGPNDPYGAKALDAARSTLRDRNNALTRIELYRTDARATRQRMIAHISSAVNALGVPYGNKQAALFLPETSARIAPVAAEFSALPAIKDHIRILGDSAWVKNADATTKGILEGAWIAAADNTRLRPFEREFNGAYGMDPTELSSLAYDAVSMMITLGERHPKGDIQPSMLMDAAGFTGSQGRYRFSPKRMVERNLAVYRMDSTGNLMILAPANADF